MDLNFTSGFTKISVKALLRHAGLEEVFMSQTEATFLHTPTLSGRVAECRSDSIHLGVGWIFKMCFIYLCAQCFVSLTKSWESLILPENMVIAILWNSLNLDLFLLKLQSKTVKHFIPSSAFIHFFYIKTTDEVFLLHHLSADQVKYCEMLYF